MDQKHINAITAPSFVDAAFAPTPRGTSNATVCAELRQLHPSIRKMIAVVIEVAAAIAVATKTDNEV